ncbi:unnamed protein product [Alternaria alternata]
MALDGLGCAMTRASQTFLIEQALCRAYYTSHDPDVVSPDGHVPEAMCKMEKLQSQVAVFAFTLDFSILITGFLVSLIYTQLASVVGKRNVLLLNTTSFALRMAWYTSVFYFHNSITHVRWVLLSCVFDLFGGGLPMREILLYSYVAESVPGDGMRNPTRMGTFNLLTAILIGTMSLGTFVSASLLNVNVFITCGLVVSVYVALVPLVAMFPRDLPTQKQVYNMDDASAEERRSLISADDLVPPNDRSSLVADHGGALEAHKTSKGPVPTMFRALLRAATVELRLSIMLVAQTIRHPLTRPVMLIYFGTTLASCISLTTQQWASGTFHTGISNIDKVTAMEQVVSATTLLALPGLAAYLLRWRQRSKEAVDYLIIVGSLSTSLAGVLIIAMAPSLTIYAVGVAVAATSMGLSDALRSYATSAVAEKDMVQRLYMSIRTVQTLAAIVGSPLWSGYFVWLIKHPNVPRGSLYLGNAFLVFCSLLSAMSLRKSR